jgi:hypothetical protein
VFNWFEFVVRLKIRKPPQTTIDDVGKALLLGHLKYKYKKDEIIKKVLIL